MSWLSKFLDYKDKTVWIKKTFRFSWTGYENKKEEEEKNGKDKKQDN